MAENGNGKVASDSPKEVYTIREIADIKRCSVQAVHQMIKRHKMKCVRLRIGLVTCLSKKQAEILIKSVAVGGQVTGKRALRNDKVS